MKNWEDIVKDKLEGYESSLPEGSLAEFRALRNGAGNALPKKRYPLAWGTLLIAAAACVAAVLFMRQPSSPEDMIQKVERPAVVAEAESVDAPAHTMVAQAVTASSAEQTRQPEVHSVGQPVEQSDETSVGQSGETSIVQSDEHQDNQAEGQAVGQSGEPTDEQSVEQSAEQSVDHVTDWPDNQASAISPFIPDTPKQEVKKMKVGAAAGCITGGGLLAALVPSLKNTGDNKSYGDASPVGHEYSNPGRPDYFYKKDKEFCFPLKAGLSLRIPISEKLSITTGADYSRYTTRFTCQGIPDEIQVAQYIGIPVRLDWTMASNRWLDVYLGGGLEGDVCVAASYKGYSVDKDGPSLHLIGAGGIQFNLSRRLGIYLEPQLSWTLCTKDRVLETYRSQDSINFLLATGLRFKLGD